MNEFLKDVIKLKRRILVVDDEEINRRMLSKILSSEYEVLTAENGDRAIEIITGERELLSLILLDLYMPGKDGYEVLKLIRETPRLKKIPVIVLTSDGSAEVQSLKLGAADFIPKPYDLPDVILARIEKTIQLYEAINIVKATQFDPLTGLYNKEYFMEYALVMDQFYREREMDAVAVNINRFHILNEIHGRIIGDRILRMIGRALKEYAEEHDGIACRYDADGYFLYLPHGEDVYSGLSEKIKSIEDGIIKNIHNRIRYGIYPRSDRKCDIHRRFDCALLACNSIKGDYKREVSYYDSSMLEFEAYSERLAADMDQGLSEGRFKVYYQPKYFIQSEEPYLSSAEALIRWDHPELGMISPGQFIPIFEGNGMIRKLDRFVWREAARQIGEWKRLHGKSLPVSVNVSRIDLMETGFTDEIRSIMDEAGITPEEFLLEVTESAYTEDSDRIIEVVKNLRSLGMRIEMDDFGTGYSSLNMLSSLPIDVLKLDMGFIRNIENNEKNLKMVELVMNIASYLNLKVVAEGVETKEQYKLLKKTGVHLVQGYYFSRPVPADEMEKILLKG